MERDSQKAIIIGKGGQMLKEIGKQARMEIETFLGCRIYLGLFVRVQKNWRKDPRALLEFGYPQDRELPSLLSSITLVGMYNHSSVRFPADALRSQSALLGQHVLEPSHAGVLGREFNGAAVFADGFNGSSGLRDPRRLILVYHIFSQEEKASAGNFPSGLWYCSSEHIWEFPASRLLEYFPAAASPGI